MDRSILAGTHGSLLGAPANVAFADVSDADLRALLVEALTWWIGVSGGPVDAVLGACRSLVRVRDGRWLPKVAAAQRLLETGYQPADVLSAAMAARLGTGSPPTGSAARAVQRAVRSEIRGDPPLSPEPSAH